MAQVSRETSDAELLRQMLEGDAEAFTALYHRRQPGVYRFALRMSGSPELAEDVTHDVFLALMRDGGQFDPSRGSLPAYLFGMTRNRVLRRLSRERIFSAIEDNCEGGISWEETLAAPEDPLADLSRQETVESVRQAILALPLHYRELIILCYLHETTYEEAARITGCAVGTVRSRLFRGRALLLEKLRAMREEPGAVPQNLLSRRFAV